MRAPALRARGCSLACHDLAPCAESPEVNDQILRNAALLVGAAIVGGAVVFAFKSGGSHSDNATQGAAATAAGSSQPKPQWRDPMLRPASISDHPGQSARGLAIVPHTTAPARGTQPQVDPH